MVSKVCVLSVSICVVWSDADSLLLFIYFLCIINDSQTLERVLDKEMDKPGLGALVGDAHWE